MIDDAGKRVGTILRTSPAGDVAIGFSGPTDLLLVCDVDLVVAGVAILASGDTRDHVRAVRLDPTFLQSLAGRPLAELARLGTERIDAVAGSTPRSRRSPICGGSFRRRSRSSPMPATRA